MNDRMTALINRVSRRVPVCCCDGAGFWALDVSTHHPLFGEAIPCVCQRDSMAKRRAERLRARSGMSDQVLTRWTFTAFDPSMCVTQPDQDRKRIIAHMTALKAECERYAKRPEGWLVLVGNVGTGKTHLAHAIAAAALHRDRGVYAATAPDMLDMLRSTYGEGVFNEAFAQLRQVDLLVIDDMGTERGNEWTVEKLFQIIDHRYQNQLPMVVTSNVPLAKAEGRIDRRILSRLQDGAEVKGGWVRVLALPVADFRRRRRSRAAA